MFRKIPVLHLLAAKFMHYVPEAGSIPNAYLKLSINDGLRRGILTHKTCDLIRQRQWINNIDFVKTILENVKRKTVLLNERNIMKTSVNI